MNGTGPRFQNCLAASFALHAGFFFVAHWAPFRSLGRPVIEIDLTNPILGTGPAKLGAPKRLVPKVAPGPSLPAESNKPPEAKLQPPRDWILPGPNTKTIEKPPEPAPTPGGTRDGTGTSPLPGGSGEGVDYGTPNGRGDGGAPLVGLPRLLNRDEVLANLRRFYPESERRAGREGNVLLDLHIGTDGLVGSSDVVQSGGSAFDGAAQKVAKLMRFAPAMASSGPVAVKIRQAMVFRLREE